MSDPLFSPTQNENCHLSLLSSSPVLSLKCKRQLREQDNFRGTNRSPILGPSRKMGGETPEIGAFPSPFNIDESPIKSPILKKSRIEPILSVDVNCNSALRSLNASYEILPSSPSVPSCINNSVLECSLYETESTSSESEESQLSINDVEDNQHIDSSPAVSIQTCTQTSSVPGSVSSVQSPQNLSENTKSVSDPVPATSKRKHYMKNGLAHKASQYNRRRRTEYRVWRHELARGVSNSDSDAESTLCLFILLIRPAFSLVLVDCRVLSGSVDSDFITVTLREDQSRHHNLLPGNHLLIYPPWQVINSGDRTTLVGPNLFRVLECRSVPKTPEKQSQSLQTLQTWKCPCSSSSKSSKRSSAGSCPAQTELWGLQNLK